MPPKGNNNENGSLDRSIGRLEGKMDSMVAAMNALSASFDSLEKGRLSRLEISFASLQTEVADKAKYAATWVAALIAVMVSVLAQTIFHLFIK